MRKFYLRTDHEIKTFSMINPNLGGIGHEVHYGKRDQKGRKKMCYFFKNFYGLGKLLLFLQ